MMDVRKSLRASELQPSERCICVSAARSTIQASHPNPFDEPPELREQLLLAVARPAPRSLSQSPVPQDFRLAERQRLT